jgi:hypothetical protein
MDKKVQHNAIFVGNNPRKQDIKFMNNARNPIFLKEFLVLSIEMTLKKG